MTNPANSLIQEMVIDPLLLDCNTLQRNERLQGVPLCAGGQRLFIIGKHSRNCIGNRKVETRSKNMET